MTCVARIGPVTALLLAIAGCGQSSDPDSAAPHGDAPPTPAPSAPAAAVVPDLTFVADAPLRSAVTAGAARLQQEPDSRDAWLSWSMLLAAHDWRPEAAAGFARLEALEPAEFRWPYLQAVLLATTDGGAALAAVERALALDQGYAPAQVTRGRLLLDAARLPEAKVALLCAVEQDARSLDGWLALGQLALQERDEAAAETALRRALAIDSQHPEVNGALATTCFALGRKDEAEAFARTARLQAKKVYASDPRAAIDSPPVTAKDHTDAAIVRMQQGRSDEAQALLQKALAIDPTYATAWNNLAHIQMGRRDNAAAERSLRESLKHTAAAPTAALLAKLVRGRGAAEEALALQQQAVALDEDNAELRRELALQLAERGRHAEAGQQWEWILAARPEDGGARREGVKVLRAAAAGARVGGDAAAVVAALRRALALQPESAEVRRELALLLATCSDPAARDPAGAAALLVGPASAPADDPRWLETRAAVAAANGDFAGAIEMSEQALALYRAAGNRAAIERANARWVGLRKNEALVLPLAEAE